MARSQAIPADILKIAECIWQRIDVRGPDDCWEWQGRRGVTGYGRVFLPGGKNWMAHRLAAALSGKVPGAGEYVCHTCDNPPCCNPNHLWVGTEAENVADMVRKGRQHHPRGELSSSVKLSADVIDEIRLRDRPRKELARKFGVTVYTIDDVRRARSWQHIPFSDEAAAAHDAVRRSRRAKATGAA